MLSTGKLGKHSDPCIREPSAGSAKMSASNGSDYFFKMQVREAHKKLKVTLEEKQKILAESLILQRNHILELKTMEDTPNLIEKDDRFQGCEVSFFLP